MIGLEQVTSTARLSLIENLVEGRRRVGVHCDI